MAIHRSAEADYSFYASNGGKVLAMRFGINGTGEEVRPRAFSGAATGRAYLPPETVLYALCRKIEDRKAFSWPAQGCYRR